jgi:murein L,D-transpeptidase YafK
MRLVGGRYLLLPLALVAIDPGGGASLRGLYDGRPLPAGARVDRLLILKGARRMQAWSGKTLLKIYRVALGLGGKGPKRYQGDSRTPEGRYRVAGRHHSRQFHRFLLLSYPNDADRRRYRRLRKLGKVPRGRGIGSAVGIHGEKRGFGWLPHKLINWTDGCIAVDDDEIEELYRAVKPGAPVVIRP